MPARQFSTKSGSSRKGAVSRSTRDSTPEESDAAVGRQEVRPSTCDGSKNGDGEGVGDQL